VLSDLDALDGIETDYGIKNNVAGKAWYSGSGSDSDINFTQSTGNVIDVAINGTDYCIRGYNPASSSYKTLASAATKESTAGICSGIAPSAAALADSPLAVITDYSESFESSLGLWSAGHGGDTLTTVSSPTHEGSKSARFVTNSSNYSSVVRATVSGLVAGRTYTVSGWFYTSEATDVDGVDWDPWDGTTYAQLSTTCANPSNGALTTNTWRQISCTFTTTSTSVYFVLEFGEINWTSPASHTGYIDEITLTHI
jgi:hypothetical protein